MVLKVLLAALSVAPSFRFIRFPFSTPTGIRAVSPCLIAVVTAKPFLRAQRDVCFVADFVLRVLLLRGTCRIWDGTSLVPGGLRAP